MAPDRGQSPSAIATGSDSNHASRDMRASDEAPTSRRRSGTQRLLAEQASQPQSFTVRGVLVGLAIGVVICFSNMYFGLQTGWVSGMAMPSALIGFAYFKTVSRLLKFPFTPVENVLVQSVAGAVGTMPLGCGFVGVIPALDYLLKPEEGGKLNISLWRLIIWSVGICFFGVVFAVPLRREVIIREKLKFPSGTATALMIQVLHGDEKSKKLIERSSGTAPADEEEERLLSPSIQDPDEHHMRSEQADERVEEEHDMEDDGDWKGKIRLLVIAFGGSALYVGIPCYSKPHMTDKHRPSCLTSSRTSMTSPYSVYHLPATGSGP
jgi:OPT family oligopeptide transporter